jgi:hypothetical protein
MNKGTKAVLGIVFIAIFLLLIYQQIEIENLKPAQPQPTTHPTVNSTPTPSTTSNPTKTPKIPSGYSEVPSTIVTTQLSVSSQDVGLVIIGNVTNNSAKTLHNLGLHIYSYGYPYFQTTPTTTIDTVIPIASNIYYSTNRTLTTMSPYETISIYIIIPSDLRGTTDYGNEVTVVQAI